MKPALLLGLLLAALAAAPAQAQRSVSGTIGAAPAAPATATTATTATTSTVAPAPATPAGAAAAAAQSAPQDTAVPAAPAAVPSAPPAGALPAAPARAPLPAMTLPAPAPSATGGLLQSIFALGFVLALLVGAAWLLKRFGPKSVTGGAHVRLVGALSVGARERILVVEVGEQWIVVGASPGRMNALATMARQPHDPADDAVLAPALPGAQFAEWLKHTIEKRNGK
ncbi:flagellar biosynthetic protein FliO [Rugamonas apoptosis]|uniref:Flagellar protein n=1 Tax=Rugamonas apoptosis TaxID=2758570 RepID=A0A7W2IJ61_9BURK|nr:flagellar biosynthetic protein FliO [Rugamonas apoptosis]MBA5686430.1 flagellar biosynthetic protein FliO [Rugamonas apoptosis]